MSVPPVGPAVVPVEPARFAEITTTVERIEAAVRRADGHPALGDSVWRDLAHPGGDSCGFSAGDDAYAHLARADNHVAGQWSLGITIAPPARTTGARVALIEAALAHVAARGGGRVACWVLGADATTDRDLASCGFVADRDLYEMRVPLPLATAAPWPTAFDVRDFVPGRDDDAWLAVNNRAFAGHEEQGDWTAETLARRLGEAWFDPSLFLLAVDEDGIAGFNWCKVHPATDTDPPLGEIYVIGVDPRTQGTGLGRALAVAGLERLAARGIMIGMLFCAADNLPALKLYRALGFDVHRIDRAYEREVAPA